LDLDWRKAKSKNKAAHPVKNDHTEAYLILRAFGFFMVSDDMRLAHALSFGCW
jgi:hypothetical protein